MKADESVWNDFLFDSPAPSCLPRVSFLSEARTCETAIPTLPPKFDFISMPPKNQITYERRDSATQPGTHRRRTISRSQINCCGPSGHRRCDFGKFLQSVAQSRARRNVSLGRA